MTAATKGARPPPQDPLRIVQAEFLAGAAPGSVLPAPTVVEIAFGGRSNVGKSSLINSLCDRKNLVRTSSKPGSTRQLNLYGVRTLDGAVLQLVDLPGYGFTHRSKAEVKAWGVLIEGYLGGRVTLAAVTILVDIRRGLEREEDELVDFIEKASDAQRRPPVVVVVATKIDKVSKSERKVALARIAAQAKGKHRVLGFSAVTGEGKVELWSFLRTAASVGAPPP